MNERIKELAKQSGFDGFEALDERNFKFAELIVRECIGQVSMSIPDTMCSASGAYKTARLAAISSIKQHFGVEE